MLLQCAAGLLYCCSVLHTALLSSGWAQAVHVLHRSGQAKAGSPDAGSSQAQGPGHNLAGISSSIRFATQLPEPCPDNGLLLSRLCLKPAYLTLLQVCSVIANFSWRAATSSSGVPATS